VLLMDCVMLAVTVSVAVDDELDVCVSLEDPD